jgi:hypothetical protein
MPDNTGLLILERIHITITRKVRTPIGDTCHLSFLTIKSGNTPGRLEDWKIGYRFTVGAFQPSNLPATITCFENQN